MNLADRLRELAEHLPPGGSLTLTRDGLLELEHGNWRGVRQEVDVTCVCFNWAEEGVHAGDCVSQRFQLL